MLQEKGERQQKGMILGGEGMGGKYLMSKDEYW